MMKRLRPMKRNLLYASKVYANFTVAEVKWTLESFRPILARYGYDEIYEVWLDALEKRVTDPVVLANRLQDTLLRTAGLANWGEYWYSDAHGSNVPVVTTTALP
jgi:hypothetical protein